MRVGTNTRTRTTPNVEKLVSTRIGGQQRDLVWLLPFAKVQVQVERLAPVWLRMRSWVWARAKYSYRDRSSRP